MTRRTLPIKLDARMEEPARRRFSGRPLAQVMAARGRWVSMALTIVRAYVAAGCPDQGLPPLLSFDAWTQLVRSPMVWLGLGDPAQRLYEGLRDDPDRELLGRLLRAWVEKFGNRTVSVKQVLDYIGTVVGQESDLASVVREIAGERESVNRSRFGWWLRKKAGQIVGGLRIVQAESGRTAQWRVE